MKPDKEKVARVLMSNAWNWATLATCSRLNVGAVLTRDGRIISTGYNGAESGAPHCNHHDNTPCDRAVHAEANVIARAARYGIPTEGTHLYVTHAPCAVCARLLVNAGIAHVTYDLGYRSTAGLDTLTRAGITLHRYQLGGPL